LHHSPTLDFDGEFGGPQLGGNLLILFSPAAFKIEDEHEHDNEHDLKI
jgi:hypothetical protein